MNGFFTLLGIENIKLWKRLSTKIMLIIMAVIIVSGVGLLKYYDYRYAKNQSKSQSTVSDNWKAQTSAELVGLKSQLKAYESPSAGKMQKAFIGGTKIEIAKDQYQLDHNVKPLESTNIWKKMMSFESDVNYGMLFALFLVIACSASVAGEFSEGTMKTMVSRPFKRSEIMAAKLVSTILYGLIMLAASFLLTFLAIGIAFGFGGLSSGHLLWTGSKVILLPGFLKTAVIFGADFLQVLVYVVLAFAISAIFRSRSISTGFSLILLVLGTSLSQVAAVYFDWGKYILFSLTNYNSYLGEGSSNFIIYGTSLPFALTVSAVYVAVMLFAGFFVFQKRDI
ncbi:MAG TPA: ABC transporter permease subunit [Clostridia bacterium]|nr:ABC transporter permease subunit [Clostridia bacterium]